MPGPRMRMRMRPWLENMIESNAVSGFVWLDKEKKMFSIPWKHAARHGWEVDRDACLFKQWAVHTGKYKQGETTPDPKTWKANFRNALNSLPDVEEVKDKSVNKGHQAVRVYRMLHPPAKTKENRSKAKDRKRRNKPIKAEKRSEDMDWKGTPSPAHEQQTQIKEDNGSTQENTVDSTEQHDFMYMSPSQVPDWSASVEIGPDSTNDLYRRFEVSPEHSPGYDDSEDFFKICQQQELDTLRMQSSSEGMGLLSNESCTDCYSNSSPGSQWSDLSAGEELNVRLYMDLDAGLRTQTDGSQSSTCTNLYQHITCQL